MTLAEQLDQLDDDLRARLATRGFDRERLIRWSGEMGKGQEARNLLVGDVARVADASICAVAEAGSKEHEAALEAGSRALAAGELAVCVLAGGMATRMGGVVKALVELAPGTTFLDVALSERERVRETHGHATPLWLMTSEPTFGPIRDALAAKGNPNDVEPFEQFVSLRLTEEADLFIGDNGKPSVYATGHGDLPDALRASGLLRAFVERGGRYVWISNLDNLGARIDAALLGQHILSDAGLTVEVVDKHPGDKGGGPVTLDGKPIIAEHFRLPPSFDADAVPVFNTNTFIVDAKQLAEFMLEWTYVEVHKQVAVEGQPRAAVQFERLLGEMTMAIPPRFQRVSREGDSSRFLPMKSREDLSRNADAIARLVASLQPASGSS